jgi:chromosome partitioning protein
MAKTVALINMKGGVGKSTLTVNLAHQFAGYQKWSKNVLVVDLDPQFNASQYLLGANRYAREIVAAARPTVWDIFEQRTRIPGSAPPSPVDPAKAIVNVITYQPSKSRIDLVASRLELAWSMKHPAEKEGLLEKFIEKVQANYDLILIDCAPTESLLSTAAYLASEFILVPVKPEYLSTIGLPLLARSLQEFHTHYDDHTVTVAGVVFNHATDYQPEEVKSKREVRTEATKLGWVVFDHEVNYSRSYPKGAREGRPIFRTSNAQSQVKTAFHAFATDFAQAIAL